MFFPAWVLLLFFCVYPNAQKTVLATTTAKKITGSDARKNGFPHKSSQTFRIHFLSRLYRILWYNPKLAVNRKSRARRDAPLLSAPCRKRTKNSTQRTHNTKKNHACRILRYTLSKQWRQFTKLKAPNKKINKSSLHAGNYIARTACACCCSGSPCDFAHVLPCLVTTSPRMERAPVRHRVAT